LVFLFETLQFHIDIEDEKNIEKLTQNGSEGQTPKFFIYYSSVDCKSNECFHRNQTKQHLQNYNERLRTTFKIKSQYVPTYSFKYEQTNVLSHDQVMGLLTLFSVVRVERPNLAVIRSETTKNS